ncbi:hypothetical protein [Klebsiella phage vB_KpnP_cmc355D]|uniref:Phage protein n=1 Tax=Klebsiella phage vB_KpnP_cmc355D TaxID=3110534 RepID=A0ABZ0ZXQ5_9CAUD|nr:hypothetical protein [Klebsiella phage vB_KpnP_cmc355D]
MSILKKFDELMSHLNGEENGMADEFRKKLEARLEFLERQDAELSALEAGGVDNWEWYSESLRDAGLLDDDEEDEDDE